MPEFDWNASNEEHIRAHGVEPEEAEDAVGDPRRLRAPAYNTPTEKRRAVWGATKDGEILFVVTTERGGRTRVVSARPATENERGNYRNRGR